MNFTTSSRIRLAIGPALLASTMLTGLPARADTLETVVVTAEKRSEDLQKVPMNVQAFTSDKLNALNLTDFNSFSRYMPSVTYSVSGQGSNGGPGLSNITMRGIVTDQNGNHSGPLPTAGVYFDEQPITNIGGTLDIPTFDVERVEALSGPQGTLYGASSLSGTLRIISNKPDTSGFAANIEVGTNSVEHGGWGYDAHGMMNIPLDDNMAIRLVGWTEHDAGYIDNVPGTRTYIIPTPPGTFTINNAAFVKNDYNTVDKTGGRAALRIDLNDSWTITPTLTAQTEKSNGFWGTDPGVGDLKVQHYNPEFVRDTWYQAALTVQGKIADLDLVYSGGYMHRSLDSQADYSDYTFWYDQLFGSSYAAFYDGGGLNVDPSQVVLGHDGFSKQSHELRLSTPKENRWRVTAGLFYENQTHKILQNYTVPGYVTSPVGDPITGWPSTLYLADEFRVDTDRAVFADAAFDITDRLTLNAGIRFFNSNNSLLGFFGFHSYENPLRPGAHCFAPAIYDDTPCTDISNKTSSSGETHRVNLTWQIDDDKMIYGTISTGFRPGGANRVIAPGVPDTYTPDTLTNYEVGWKTSWLDNRLRFNGALYWEDWKNIQFSFLGPFSITIVQNAGGARVKGAEFDLSYLPIDGLTLSSSGAYNDASLTVPFCQNVGPCPNATADAPIGTSLPITPRWKVNGSARYEWTLDNGFDAHVQGSLVHQSGIYSDLRTQSGGVPGTGARYVLGKSPASTTFDATAGITQDDWGIELYVKNFTDERAQLGRFAACNPYTCGAQTYQLVAQPRTFGLKLMKRFGGDVGNTGE